jgi:hypothetical protein
MQSLSLKYSWIAGQAKIVFSRIKKDAFVYTAIAISAAVLLMSTCLTPRHSERKKNTARRQEQSSKRLPD